MPDDIRPTDPATPPTDYLWDRTGPVDEGVAELERVLAPLGHRGTLPGELTGPSRRTRWPLWSGAIAAALLLACVGVYWSMLRPTPRHPISWTVASATGSYKLGEPGPLKGPGAAESGQWIETAAGAGVRLEGGAGGIVSVEGASRVRIIDLGPGVQRVQIAYGSLSTEPSKSAAPIEVVTSAGVATVAPGTACVVSFGGDLKGSVQVKTGRVEFNHEGVRTRLGANSSAPLSEYGVATPRSGTASAALTAALAKHDVEGLWQDAAVTRRYLTEALLATTASDAATLWNLMWRVPAEDRKKVLGRARQVLGGMKSLDDDAIMRLDPQAMDTWWKHLESR